MLAITTDPHNKYPKRSPQHLTEMCGLLWAWIVHNTHESMKDRLITSYPFYSGEMTGGALNLEGVYTYPGDPDLYPLMMFETHTEVCFVFEYGIVGVVNRTDGCTWVARMD